MADVTDLPLSVRIDLADRMVIRSPWDHIWNHLAVEDRLWVMQQVEAVGLKLSDLR